jgi:3-phosphoshikimate 1-carboxyvinyltransferase
MRRVIAPLERMGARIDATDGHAPVTVHGALLHAIAHRPETPSAQVKSAVLLAGLHADGTTSVTEPAATRDHTERALAAFGGHASVDGLTVSVAGGQRLQGRTLTVPGDFSSAAFWLVAAAALPGSRVEIEDVGLNPTRTGLLDVLRRFGARVEAEVAVTDAGEPRGTIVVEGDRTGSVDIAPEEVPGLIDELPAIAALSAHGGEVTVRGAGELRVRKATGSRRWSPGSAASASTPTSATTALSSAGRRADPRGRPAGRRTPTAITGWPWPAIAALAAERPSRIDGADVVAVSYPDFFATLDRLVS